MPDQNETVNTCLQVTYLTELTQVKLTFTPANDDPVVNVRLPMERVVELRDQLETCLEKSKE